MPSKDYFHILHRFRLLELLVSYNLFNVQERVSGRECFSLEIIRNPRPFPQDHFRISESGLRAVLVCQAYFLSFQVLPDISQYFQIISREYPQAQSKIIIESAVKISEGLTDETQSVKS